MAGEREKDVVERRAVQRDVVDADPGRHEPLDRVDDRAAALAHSHLDQGAACADRLVARRLERAERRRRLLRALEGDLEARATHPVLQLVGGPLGEQAPVVDHRDPAGQPIRLVEVLRCQQHRRTVFDKPVDRLPQPQAAARIEARRRLIEKQHRRVGDERRREVEPPAHSAGVGLRRSARRIDQVEAFEQLAAAPLRGRPGLAVEAADHCQVLEPGQVLVDRRVLAGEPDLRPQRRRVADDVEAEDGRAAAVGPQQRREDPDKRRLAGAVGAEQPQDRAGRDVEVDSVECPHRAE